MWRSLIKLTSFSVNERTLPAPVCSASTPAPIRIKAHSSSHNDTLDCGSALYCNRTYTLGSCRPVSADVMSCSSSLNAFYSRPWMCLQHDHSRPVCSRSSGHAQYVPHHTNLDLTDLLTRVTDRCNDNRYSTSLHVTSTDTEFGEDASPQRL